jgi:hypothetical protein
VGFGRLDGLIGNHFFDGGCGNGGEGNTIMNATIMEAVEVAMERGWGGHLLRMGWKYQESMCSCGKIHM